MCRPHALPKLLPDLTSFMNSCPPLCAHTVSGFTFISQPRFIGVLWQGVGSRWLSISIFAPEALQNPGPRLSATPLASAPPGWGRGYSVRHASCPSLRPLPCPCSNCFVHCHGHSLLNALREPHGEPYGDPQQHRHGLHQPHGDGKLHRHLHPDLSPGSERRARASGPLCCCHTRVLPPIGALFNPLPLHDFSPVNEQQIRGRAGLREKRWAAWLACACSPPPPQWKGANQMKAHRTRDSDVHLGLAQPRVLPLEHPFANRTTPPPLALHWQPSDALAIRMAAGEVRDARHLQGAGGGGSRE